MRFFSSCWQQEGTKELNLLDEDDVEQANGGCDGSDRAPKTLVYLVMALVLMPSTVAFSNSDDEEKLPPGVVYEDQAAAFAHDAQLMAEQTGFPLDDVERALAF